jgi:hypothetical protein
MTRRCLRRLGRLVWHGHIIIRRTLFVIAFRHTSPCPTWPLVFRRSRLADGDHSVVSDSAPVFAAGGAFATGTAVSLIACDVHAHCAVRPGTRVAARKDLYCVCTSFSYGRFFFSFFCLVDKGRLLGRRGTRRTHLEADRTIHNFFWISGLEVRLQL